MAISEPYRAFDVVVVPFPYADRLAEKRRPALVVSDESLARFGVIWLAMITSADNPPWSCDIPISDLAEAGLPAPSVIRPAKVACVDPARVLYRSGALGPSAAKRVALELRRFLARAAAPASRRKK